MQHGRLFFYGNLIIMCGHLMSLQRFSLLSLSTLFMLRHETLRIASRTR